MTDTNPSQQVLDLIQAFGEKIGIPRLAPDTEGMLVLRIDGQEYLMAVRPVSEKIYLLKRLRSVPENTSDELKLLRLISEINCFQRHTKGGAIGTFNRGLYYSVGFPYTSMTPLALETAVSEMIDTATSLTNQIREAMAVPENEPSSEDSFDPNNIMVPV